MDTKPINPIFEKKEQILREQRTVEAMRKGLMGGKGKIARIAKIFGEPIIRHDTNWIQKNYLADPFDLPDPNSIPVAEEDEMSFEIGYHYDGVRTGHHLEIIWKSEFQEITCYFKGNIVYFEIGGILDGYSPGDWEKQVEILFERVRKQERNLAKIHKADNTEVFAKEREEFLQRMKKKWNF